MTRSRDDSPDDRQWRRDQRDVDPFTRGDHPKKGSYQHSTYKQGDHGEYGRRKDSEAYAREQEKSRKEEKERRERE